VGWLDRRRARKAEQDSSKRFAGWQAEDEQLRQFLEEARSNQGVDDGFGLVLKADERTFQVLQGPSLIEPRRLPGHWEGRSQGFSIPITKGGLRYRVGSSKGQYVQGDETPTPIDTGTITITNQRVVFQGTKASREWAFSKLLGLQHVDNPKWPWTAIQVSNRQKTSGFTYPAELAAPIRFRLDLALAHFHGEVDDFAAGIEEHLAQHGLECPAPALPAPEATYPPPSPAAIAPPPPPGAQPAAWLSDPTGRHERRYWDGSRWTAHVVDGDQRTMDAV